MASTAKSADEKDPSTTYQSLSIMPQLARGDTLEDGAKMEDSQPQSTWQRVLTDYRLLEFVGTVAMYAVALVFALIPVHDRPIPSIRIRINSTTTFYALDPALDEPKLAEQVPMWALLSFGVGLPLATNYTVNYVLPKMWNVRVIAHDTRDFLLTLFQSMAMTTLLTQFTKSITGRFRPSFYDMCKWNHDVVWDGVTNLCTDSAGEKEGRKSFPSGHASFAWSTMLVLTLYLLGRSRLNCENRSDSMLRGGKKSLLLFLCCAPTLLAAWVSVTRSIDNWHHYSDILAGSIIGAVSASLTYSYNYGSIFCWDSAGLPLEVLHERRMQDKHDCSLHPPASQQRVLQKCVSSRCDYIVDLGTRDSNSWQP